eukprot:13374169-Ditylum_brightwellii.AAC.1
MESTPTSKTVYNYHHQEFQVNTILPSSPQNCTNTIIEYVFVKNCNQYLRLALTMPRSLKNENTTDYHCKYCAAGCGFKTQE